MLRPTKTILQLPPATLPLAGDEDFECVQGLVSTRIQSRAFVLPTDSLVTLSSMAGFLPGSRQLTSSLTITVNDGGNGGQVSLDLSPAALATVVPITREINTANSLQGGGNLSADRTLSLVGDVLLPGANMYYGTDGTGTRGWYANSGGTPGNPTALVGLAPVNGVATTYMRSDAAPALNQAISPTWTGIHNFTDEVNFSGEFKADGVEGIAGQVLSSQGPGLPAIWRTSSGGSIDLGWNFDTGTANVNPGSQKLAFNQNTYAATTVIKFNSLAFGNYDANTILSLLQPGNRIYLQGRNLASKAVVFEVTATGTDNTGWWSIPVMFINSRGTLFTQNLDLSVVFILSTSSSASANPTALAGRNPVNGVATTWMRSDAAPALDFTALYTDTLPGFVPPSGGGSLSFLRADGVWAVPPGGGSGSPGGATTQIQYNNAGAFGGISIFAYNGTSLLIGGGASRQVALGTGVLQIEGTSIATGLMTLVTNLASGAAGGIRFAKSRSAALGGVTIVQSGDTLAEIYFAGADGTDLNSIAASIQVLVDGTPGVDDMPGRMVFSTTADGAAGSTERFRISSFGGWGLAGANYGTAGQALTSNGNAAAPTWQSLPSQVATPANSVQFNNAGAFGGDADFVYSSATNTLSLGSQANNGIIDGGPAASATSNGNSLIIQGGVAGATSGAGGSVTIRGAVPGADGNGGGVNLISRAGVGTNRNGGNITVTLGGPTGSGTAGTFAINGAAAAANASSGGTDINLNAGANSATVGSTPGNITLTAGAQASGSGRGGTTALVGGDFGGDVTATGGGGGGRVFITGGVGTVAGYQAGGTVTITGGGGSTTVAGSNAGSVILNGGTPVDGNGGSISLSATNGIGTNRNGGNVTIAAGAATGAGTAGAIRLVSQVFEGFTSTEAGQILANTQIWNSLISTSVEGFFRVYQAAGQPEIQVMRVNGAYNAATAIAANDVIGNIAFMGSTGAGSNTGAYVRATAGSLWSGTNNEAFLSLYVTASGATAATTLAATFAATAIALNTATTITQNGQAMNLKSGAGGTSIYMAFYRDGAAQSTRTAYVGHGTPGSNDFYVAAEGTNANILLSVTGSTASVISVQDFRSRGEVRAVGWYNTPTADQLGPGMEMGYTGGSGQLVSYDRTGSAYKPMTITGSQIDMTIGATQCLRITTGGNVSLMRDQVYSSDNVKSIQFNLGAYSYGGTVFHGIQGAWYGWIVNDGSRLPSFLTNGSGTTGIYNQGTSAGWLIQDDGTNVNMGSPGAYRPCVAASFNAASARAMKRETGRPGRAREILTKLRPILYELLNGAGGEQLGLVAEEVHEICPQLSDGKSVAYDRLALLLLADWQETQGVEA